MNPAHRVHGLAAAALLAFSSGGDACNNSSCSLAILPEDQQITAVRDGDWHKAGTWDLGRVPQPGDNVVIPGDTKVTWASREPVSAESDPIRSIRIDGELYFVPWWKARLVVDTIVVNDEGALRVGKPDRPVARWHWVEIIFRGDPLDPVQDPNLKGRGLVSHGTVEIFGETRTPYVELGPGPDAISADGLTVTLAEAPTHWRPGQELLVTGNRRTDKVHGTQYTLDNYTTRDEVRSVTAINGEVVTLDQPLTPGFHERDLPGMPILVGNLSRNVILRTAEEDVDNIAERAHAMFMSRPNVILDGVAFLGMGRSNKDEPLTQMPQDDGGTADANMKGRYPVHFHQIGQETERAAVIRNSVIRDSPGWGISLHSSHGVIEDNITFEIFASHIVAEDGDERGSVRRNLAVKSVGDTRGIKRHETTDPDGTTFQDDGQRGHGYWFLSRNLAVEDNFAFSHGDEGFVYFHRHSDRISVPREYLLTEHRDLLGENVSRDDVPIVVSNRNVAVGCSKALHVIKANNNQGHDIRNMFVGWRAYHVGTGFEVQYTGEYTFRDFAAYTPGNGSSYSAAFKHGNKVIDMVHVNFVADGWSRPFTMSETFSGGSDVGNMLFVAGMVREDDEPAQVPFDRDLHLWKDKQEPDNGGSLWYVPSVHEQVPYHPDMDLDSDYVMQAPVMDALQVAADGTPAADWPRVKLDATGLKTDSAGTAPRDPAYDQTFSYWKYWGGGSLRYIVTDESYWVAGTRYIDLTDHAADRVNGKVVEFTYPVEVTPYVE